MGTRSTTKIYKTNNGMKKEPILSLYKQWDGYPDGWGEELKEFIKKCIVVNGYNKERDSKKNKLLCNGVGCFALQLVKEFKEGTGDLYATTQEDEQEFNYEIIFDILESDGFSSRYIEVNLICHEYKDFNQTYLIDKYGCIKEK